MDKYKEKRSKKSDKKTLLNAKKEFNNEINSYKLMLTRMIVNSTETTIEKTIKQLYTLSNYYIKSINNIKNIEELNNEFIRFKANVSIILNNYITEYCQKYNIKTDRNKLEKYWFNKLCEELEEILNKDNEIEQLLNKKELEYLSYPDYEIIKKRIPEIKKHVMKMYYENYTSKENILKHFAFRIAVARKTYYERQEVINYYKGLSSTDNFIINQIRLMEENIDGDTHTFKKLEVELKKHIEEKKSNSIKKEEKDKQKKQSRFIKILKKKK